MNNDTLFDHILRNLRLYGEALLKPCARFAGLTEQRLETRLAEIEAAEAQTRRFSEAQAEALRPQRLRQDVIRLLKLGIPAAFTPT